MPRLSETIFKKLIVRRSKVCSNWPAIQCVVIGQIPQACDGNVMPFTVLWCCVPARPHKNNETHYKRGIYCIQWGYNHWLQWLILFFMCRVALCRVNMTICDRRNDKQALLSTLLNTHVWIVSSKFFKYETILTGCESEAPHCPCKVGIAPLYRNSLCVQKHCRLLSSRLRK